MHNAQSAKIKPRKFSNTIVKIYKTQGGILMAWNELIRRNDALEIVRRTNGDYAAAFSAINRLETMPSVSAIPAK